MTLSFVAAWTWYLASRLVGFHDRHATHAFDLGVFDNVLWLMSRREAPYSTVLGLDMRGDHGAFVLYPLSLLYTVFHDVRALLVLKVVVIGVGALALFALGRQRGAPWTGSLVVVAYLAHPFVQNFTLFQFHPDALAAAALLWALWAAETSHTRTLFVLALVIVTCKENFALTVIGLAVAVFLGGRRRAGLLLAAFAMVWFLVMVMVVIPHFNGLGQSAFVAGRFGAFGSSPGEVVRTMLLHPGRVASAVFTREAALYVAFLLLPFGFLSLFRPRLLAVALPALGLNLLSSFGAQRSGMFHYDALTTAALAVPALIALIEIPVLRRNGLGAGLVGAGLVTAIVLAPSSLRTVNEVLRRPGEGAWSTDRLLEGVPRDARVSAQTYFVPHLSQRRQIYLFPEPFRKSVLMNPSALPFASSVDVIVLNPEDLDDSHVPAAEKKAVLAGLEERGLFLRAREAGKVVMLVRGAIGGLPESCFGPGWEAAECRLR